MISPYVQPGITTNELDRMCHDYIVNVQKAVPAPLNYRGFPKSICTSVNHQVCHGIPSDKVLKNGDILNIDITVIKNGFHGDASRMFCLGKPSIRAQRLIDVAYECLWIGIREALPGVPLNNIGRAVQTYAESRNCSVVREYCGHGIGREFHEEPQVLHYRESDPGPTLLPGMTFTIEPMINAGRKEVKLLPDGWTVVTKDHHLSAQWEHTVLITEQGTEILTLGKGETPPI